MIDWISVVIVLVVMIVVLVFVLMAMAYMTLFERKVMARMQDRMGPMLAGPHGVFQPFADAIKLLFKEGVVPAKADKWVFFFAPVIPFVCAVIAFAIVPFTGDFELFGRTIHAYIADINVGVLFVLAVSSFSVYGIVMGAWASNNKYSLLGGLRSTAQVISYEVVLGLSLVGVFMLSRSFTLQGIVAAQTPIWYIVLQPLAFVIYLIAAVAETNRSPFDMPEAENELVAGFYTEYSGFWFAFYFLGEYIWMIAISALASAIFLGGWHGPFLPTPLNVVWFLAKMVFFLFLYVWIRSTLPRFRYDQVMGLCWKILLPAALLNIVATATVKIIFHI